MNYSLKKYFKGKANDELYNVLCKYNEDTDLKIDDYDFLFGGMTIYINDDKNVFEIRNEAVYKLDAENNELVNIITFPEVLNKIEKDPDVNGWDVLIDYLQKELVNDN